MEFGNQANSLENKKEVIKYVPFVVNYSHSAPEYHRDIQFTMKAPKNGKKERKQIQYSYRLVLHE